MSGSINFDNGLTGIRSGIDGMQKAASQIANKDSMTVGSSHDLATSLVELKVRQLQVSASAQVVKAADDMIGTLLDIKA